MSGTSGNTNIDYSMGSSGGDFKIISKIGGASTDRMVLNSTGEFVFNGSISATSCIVGGANILTNISDSRDTSNILVGRINDTSNFVASTCNILINLMSTTAIVASTSNILVGRISDTSNYVASTCNILINLMSTTAIVASTSNILVGRISDTSNYVASTCNILINLMSTTTVVASTSNILVGRISDTSNYVASTSNILVTLATIKETNTSNYVASTSNILVGRISDTSNYVASTSNILVGRISDTSNYVASTSNILVTLATIKESNTSNYVASTSNILVTLAIIKETNTSNYVASTSNILVTLAIIKETNTSNYVASTSNILVSNVNLNDTNTSNYVASTSNIISKRIYELNTDKINELPDAQNRFIVNNKYNNNLEITGDLKVRDLTLRNFIITGTTTTVNTAVTTATATVFSADQLNVVNVINNSPAIMVQQKKALYDIFVASNINTNVFNIANNGDVNINGIYKKNNRDVIDDTSNYITSTNNILATKANLNDTNSSNYVVSTSDILVSKTNLNNTNSSNYVASTSNILVTKANLNDTNSSNYIVSTSNILVAKANLNDTNSSNYIVSTSNILIGRINDTSNYVVYTSNILINKANLNDTNSSNYVVYTSNILINKANLNDTNSSNYVVYTSNILINKANLNDTNSSNYIVFTSNILVNKANLNDTNSSNYIVFTSNILVKRILAEDIFGSNYVASTSNILINKANLNDTNSSNYVAYTSNILVKRILAEDIFGSNYVAYTSNILVKRILAEDIFGSNYVAYTSNILVKRILAEDIFGSNYVAYTSNILINKANLNDTNSSNYVAYTSNILVKRILAEDIFGSNYVTTTSNILVIKTNLNDSNSSNYVVYTSNILVKRLIDEDKFTSNYVASTSNILVIKANFNDTNTSNYVAYTSNILINLISKPTVVANDTNTSNYVTTTSNILVIKSNLNDTNSSNYVTTTSNILVIKSNLNDTNSSNYVTTTSNILINLISNFKSDRITGATQQLVTVPNITESTNYISSTPNIDNATLKNIKTINGEYIISTSSTSQTAEVGKIEFIFDNNTSTYWRTQTPSYFKQPDGIFTTETNFPTVITTPSLTIYGEWIQVKFPRRTCVYDIEVTPYVPYGTYEASIKNWYLLATNNVAGNEWISVYSNITKTYSSTSTQSLLPTSSNKNTISYLYYRLVITEIIGTSALLNGSQLYLLLTNIKFINNDYKIILDDAIVCIGKPINTTPAFNTILDVNGDANFNGSISATSCIVGGTNILTTTSNYVNYTSNILVTRANLNNTNSSNYVASTSNILINNANRNDTNSSNYVVYTSNILINKANLNDTNSSNYVASTNNILVGRISDTSNYVASTSNILLSIINSSSWVISGPNIYNLERNVGIGIPVPTSKLHVSDNTNSRINITSFPQLPDDIITVPPVSDTNRGIIGEYKYIKFTYNTALPDAQTTYTFNTTQSLIYDLLIVGGGGAGGFIYGGGGGAGEVYYKKNLNLGISTQSATGFISAEIKVGRGGKWSNSLSTYSQAQGLESEFKINSKVNNINSSDLYGAKGGGAGWGDENPLLPLIRQGGSGGGASSTIPQIVGAVSNNPLYITGNLLNQSNNIGNIGGNIIDASILSISVNYSGSGGGLGTLNTSVYSKYYPGINIDITGTSVLYAASGGGGTYITLPQNQEGNVADEYNRNSTNNNIMVKYLPQGNTPGGKGGVTTKLATTITTFNNPTDGLPDTGSGGGGHGNNISNAGNIPSGNGGSGVVIIKYKLDIQSSSSIALDIASDITNFQIGNYNGEFKIISTKLLPSTVNTPNLTINSDGNIILGGSINATSYLLNGVPFSIQDTSNYVASTSNILINKANLNDTNSSNYVVFTSNILINKANLNDTNSSNYVVYTSNILINKANLNDTNSSNYVVYTSNTLIKLISNIGSGSSQTNTLLNNSILVANETNNITTYPQLSYDYKDSILKTKIISGTTTLFYSNNIYPANITTSSNYISSSGVNTEKIINTNNGNYIIKVSSINATVSKIENIFDDIWSSVFPYSNFVTNSSNINAYKTTTTNTKLLNYYTSNILFDNTLIYGEWIQIKFPRKIIIKEIFAVPYTVSTHSAKKWYLLGTNDNETGWRVALEGGVDAAWIMGTEKKFTSTISNNKPYLFYRFVVVEINAGDKFALAGLRFVFDDEILYNDSLVSIGQPTTTFAVDAILDVNGGANFNGNIKASSINVIRNSWTSSLLYLNAGIVNAGTNVMAQSIGKPLMRLGNRFYSSAAPTSTTGDYYGIGFGYAPTETSFSCCEIGMITTTKNSSTGHGLGDLIFSTRTADGFNAPTERMRIYGGYGSTLVSGSVSATNGAIFKMYYFDADSPIGVLQTAANAQFTYLSVKITQGVWCTGSIISSSDRRIKEDIQDINDDSALQMILAIEPKTYKYIDKINKGNNKVYGFIAQQIREVLPEATCIQSSFIPNIMLLADYDNKIITLSSQPTNVIIKLNDKIKCYDKNNIEINVDVEQVIDELTFRIKELENTYTDTKIFVYGTYVDDFHTLDKTYIFTLNVCATQELHRRIEAQDVIIKSQDERIKKLEQILGV